MMARPLQFLLQMPRRRDLGTLGQSLPGGSVILLKGDLGSGLPWFKVLVGARYYRLIVGPYLHSD